jgi:predicted kinase
MLSGNLLNLSFQKHFQIKKMNKKMKKVIIVVGISGSGKSTWAKQFCIENPTWLRINRDDIRKSMLSVTLQEYNNWPVDEFRKIESLVTKQHNSLLINALSDGWNVIIDNTHLKASYINEYKKLLSEAFESFEISFKVFENSLEECISNDAKREDVVGKVVLMRQVEMFMTLKKNIKLHTEIFERESNIAVQNPALKSCVVVDIDGTVAKMNGRYAFDWDKVDQDLPKVEIIKLVKNLKDSGSEIIFFSGRDEVSKSKTVEWICLHFGWDTTDFQIFMRPQNDQRKDSIVKFEMYNQFLKDKYFIEFILDDRNQVVDMWRRKLGLTCLQVDYGDF